MKRGFLFSFLIFAFLFVFGSSGKGEEKDSLRIVYRDAIDKIIAGRLALLRERKREAQLDFLNAIDRLDRIRFAFEHDPLFVFLRGLALAWIEVERPDGHTEHKKEEALSLLNELRRNQPDFARGAVLNQIASLCMELGRFEEAAQAYGELDRLPFFRPVLAPPEPISLEERLWMSLFDWPEPATIALNWAEAEMLAQRLERAVGLYRLAEARAEAGSLELALARFGLALAEERRGNHEEALRQAKAAMGSWLPNAGNPLAQRLQAAHGSLAPLHHPGVVYHPPWERFAYEALAKEAIATDLLDAEQKKQVLREACGAWRRFFAWGGEASPYAKQACLALERLSKHCSTAQSESVPCHGGGENGFF
ncbi:MAG: hypothetical protein N2515_08025 [Deltaproteobacteria bacterium]|nr:hypothetical protein [Deltaproteobacteria bacterium]